MIFGKDEVKKFIPHRDPFLFIDSIESITCNEWVFGEGTLTPKDAIGGTVKGHFEVLTDMPVFKGHFPGKPVLPGVIQVEMMAQVSSFVMSFFHPDPFGESTLDVALACVNNAKFRLPVLPGDKLIINAEIKKYRRPIIITECSIYNDDKLVSQADITASVIY